MIDKINQLLQEVEALKAANAEELEALRIKFLSKKTVTFVGLINSKDETNKIREK